MRSRLMADSRSHFRTGRAVDWVKNVLARGAAAIVYQGRTYPVNEPEIIPLADATLNFTPADRLAHRLFGVKECLVVRGAEVSGDGR